MIKKIYSPQRRICQVYFRIEPSVLKQSIATFGPIKAPLPKNNDIKNNDIKNNDPNHDIKNKGQMCILGCFTEWQPIPMPKRSDGSYSIAYTLDASKQYQFRYLYEKTHWIEEPDCDGTEANPFGSSNCVLQT